MKTKLKAFRMILNEPLEFEVIARSRAEALNKGDQYLNSLLNHGDNAFKWQKEMVSSNVIGKKSKLDF